MSNAFRPKGVSASRASRGGGQERRNYPLDRLAEVEGYSGNMMYARDLDTNQKLQVTIQQRTPTVRSASAASRNTTASDKKWSGNKIDEHMAEEVAIGSWVMLESALDTGRTMRGKESIQEVSVRWIKNITEPREDKIMRGPITGKGFRGAMQSFQNWWDKANRTERNAATFDRAISVNDQESIDEFAAMLDDVAAKFANKEYPLRRGFQFRVVKVVEQPTEGTNGRPGRPGRAIPLNFSFPIDYIQEEGSQNGEGHVPTGEEFKGFINDYVDYIWGDYGRKPDEEGYVDPASPDYRQPAISVEDLEQSEIEIATYAFYKAGDTRYNDRLAYEEPEPGAIPSALYTLTNSASRWTEDEEPVVGKNLAILSYLQLVPDGVDKKTRQFVENRMARQLYTNGPRMHVHSFIKTSTGASVSMKDSPLDIIRAPRADANGESQPAGEGASQVGGADLLQASQQDALSGGGDSPFGEDGADSFLGEFNGDNAFASEPAAEAPAPAAAPAPATAPAAAPAAAPARTSRFGNKG